MKEGCATYKDLAKINRMLFFNNIYLFISNNLLTHTHTHTHTGLNKPRLIYKKYFTYTSIAYSKKSSCYFIVSLCIPVFSENIIKLYNF